jgi:5-oxoprolinase (ATP-hydrolysing) subunit C
MPLEATALKRAVLRVIAPAPFSTVQDMGRVGWRRFGVTGAGAMDVEALAVANALAGNPCDAAAVEFGHAGGEWAVVGACCRVAVAGGSFPVAVDGRPVPFLTSVVLRPGNVLRIGGARDAVWGYLAVSGGVQVPREFGSRSTHARAAIGGLDGRPLAAGDELPLRPLEDGQDGERTLLPHPVAPGDPIRVVLGPQHDHFTPAAIRTFLAAEYVLTWQGDRMGYRLEGPPLEHSRGFNIVSDGLLPGSIQVPGSGHPIVMLRDAQTTGGYPKVATVVSADIGRMAQRRPRNTVRFQAISLEDAHLLRREFIARLQATRLRVRKA